MSFRHHDTYGLVGFPLSHSFSKAFFEEKFSRENIEATYLNFEMESLSSLSEVLNRTPQLKGFNVTIPYKEKIIPYLHDLSPEAREIGAVNVVKVIRENNEPKLLGFNTDHIGFRQSLQPILHPDERHSALILGTGGASKAVVYALSGMEIRYTFVSRNPQRNQLAYSDLTEDILQKHSLIIQTTPLGTFPDTDTCPPIPYSFLSKQHIAYDLVYNPSETLFLQKAKAQSATIKNGLEMLEIQANEAWKIWTKQP